jgi:hypothetical protein
LAVAAQAAPGIERHTELLNELKPIPSRLAMKLTIDLCLILDAKRN